MKQEYLPLQRERKVGNCYLTRFEKQILFKKYIKNGLDHEEANKKVKTIVKYLQDYRDKLKYKKMSDKDINMKFREEFAKLLERDR